MPPAPSLHLCAETEREQRMHKHHGEKKAQVLSQVQQKISCCCNKHHEYGVGVKYLTRKKDLQLHLSLKHKAVTTWTFECTDHTKIM